MDSPAPSSPSKWMVHCCVTISTTLVATSFLVGKSIAPSLAPSLLVLLRFFFAVVFFFPIIQWKYRVSIPSLSSLCRYCVVSGTLVGFFWLMFLSLRYTTALNTGVIFTLVPGISGLYSAILIKERLGKNRFISLLVAMVGALWVIFQGDLERLLMLELNTGDIIFTAACLLMALYTPLVKLLHRGEPMAVMTFWILVTGCGWLILLNGPQILLYPWASISAHVWGGILYLSIFTTIITFFISQWATLHIGPTRVMAYSYLYPPVIVILQWAAGQDLPTFRTMAGVLLILPAMYVVQRDTAKAVGSNPSAVSLTDQEV